MPWLYHKYVGHDINRDAFMMNLAENRTLARFFYTQWHPQVFLTMHQMGGRGARLFVPPNYDPMNPNYDPLIWREAALLGQAMALELERDDAPASSRTRCTTTTGPGYEDSAPLGHNTVCLLTEVASARLASPHDRGGRRTLPRRPAGLPRLRAAGQLPEPVARRHAGACATSSTTSWTRCAACSAPSPRTAQQLVENFYAMGRRAVERGRAGGPFAFVIPPEQRDPNAAAKLDRPAARRRRRDAAGAGTVPRAATPPTRRHELVLMAQPYRAYAKTLLERQDYPVRAAVQDGRAGTARTTSPAGRCRGRWASRSIGSSSRSSRRSSRAVARATIPAGQVWGEQRPSFYVIDAPGTSGRSRSTGCSTPACRPPG